MLEKEAFNPFASLPVTKSFLFLDFSLFFYYLTQLDVLYFILSFYLTTDEYNSLFIRPYLITTPTLHTPSGSQSARFGYLEPRAVA